MNEEIQLDDKYLKDLGLYSSDEQQNNLNKARLLKMLNVKVQDAVLGSLDEPKTKEYLVAISDDELLTAWLAKNMPNYDSLVKEQLANLKQELSDRLDNLMVN